MSSKIVNLYPETKYSEVSSSVKSELSSQSEELEQHQSTKDDRDRLSIYKSINTKDFTKIKLFGLDIDNLSRDEVVAFILEALEKKEKLHHILFIDPIKLLRMKLNSSLRPIINQANLVLAEGGGLLWSCKKLNIPLKERISIITVVMDLMYLAMQNDYTVYLLDSKPHHIHKVFFNFQRNFPGLRVVGRKGGNFKEEEELLIKESIRKSAPDIILLGMNFPNQEKWIQDNKQYLGKAIILGLDNTLQILSGLNKQYPDWISLSGFSWLWYTLKNPWRLNRMLLTISFYFVSYIKSTWPFNLKKSKRN